MACKYDRDCPEIEICYTGSSWLTDKTVEPFNPNPESNCFCSTYYGFARDEGTGRCTKLTSFTHGFIFTDVLSGALGFIGILICFIIANRMRPFNKNKMNAATTTLIFITLSFTCVIIQMGYDIQSLYTPIFTPINFCDKFDDASDKCAQNDVQTGMFNALRLLFTLLAALNVSLLWIEACSLVKAQKKNNIQKYRYPSIFISLSYFVAIIVCGPILGQWEYAIFVTLPVYIGIVLCYSYGFYLMSKWLNTDDSGVGITDSAKERNRRTLRAIKETSILVVITILLILLSIGGSTYIYSVSWRDYSPLGEVSTTAFFDYLEVVASILTTHAILRYIRLSTAKGVKSKKSRVGSAHHEIAVAGRMQTPSLKTNTDKEINPL